MEDGDKWGDKCAGTISLWRPGEILSGMLAALWKSFYITSSEPSKFSIVLRFHAVIWAPHDPCQQNLEWNGHCFRRNLKSGRTFKYVMKATPESCFFCSDVFVDVLCLFEVYHDVGRCHHGVFLCLLILAGPQNTERKKKKQAVYPLRTYCASIVLLRGWSAPLPSNQYWMHLQGLTKQMARGKTQSLPTIFYI